MERWLRDFDDEVYRRPRPQDSAGTERLVRIGALYLRYLRDGHQVEDAREMALTLALWAGSQLAALMLDVPERIGAYLNARDHTFPPPPSS